MRHALWLADTLACLILLAASGGACAGEETPAKAMYDFKPHFQKLVSAAKSGALLLEENDVASAKPALRLDCRNLKDRGVVVNFHTPADRLAPFRGKPLVVGEFGAFKRAFPGVEPAAAWLCTLAVGFAQQGFAGWLYWTYDTHDQRDQLWDACESDGVIYRRLTLSK